MTVVTTPYYGSKQPNSSAKVKTFPTNSGYNIKVFNKLSSNTNKQPTNSDYLKAVNVMRNVNSASSCVSPCSIPCSKPCNNLCK
jgi:hypothetical protein